MAPSRILDSHIHLWPSTALQPTNQRWMTPGHQLAKRHGISDYKAVTDPVPVGFLYVETDRYLPSPEPNISESESEDERSRKMQEWAKEPLEELKFLRRIVESNGQEGDGFERGDGEMMKGCVIWAPFNVSHSLFEMYLHIADETAGPELWKRVVGFRYLLQGKGDGQVRRLVESEDWLDNMVSLRKGKNGLGWAFDIGVDTHRDGDEVLEAVVDMIEKVRKREHGKSHRVRFILNHLCKPNLSYSTPSHRWQIALSRLRSNENVFMKLSGAFNEFDTTASTTWDVVSALRPFLDLTFQNFPSRVMFGSDWPVCNVGGTRGDDGNWKFWVEIVDQAMIERKFSDEDKDVVWWRACVNAYGIEM